MCISMHKPALSQLSRVQFLTRSLRNGAIPFNHCIQSPLWLQVSGARQQARAHTHTHTHIHTHAHTHTHRQTNKQTNKQVHCMHAIHKYTLDWIEATDYQDMFLVQKWCPPPLIRTLWLVPRVVRLEEIYKIHSWNEVTPLIRGHFGQVPRVVRSEEIHCRFTNKIM